jgi:hypothetical protein
MADQASLKALTHKNEFYKLVLVLCAAFFLPAFVIAFVLWIAVHNILDRKHYVVVAIAAFAALFVGGLDVWTGYFGHFVTLVTDFSFFNVVAWPLFQTLVFALLIFGVIGAIFGDAFVDTIPALLRRNKLAEVGRQDFLPTDRDRSKLKRVVTPSTSGFVADPLPDVDISGPVGTRVFPMGLDIKGKVVSLSEKEVGTHGIILGSTGSGKTECIKRLAAGLADLGQDGIVLDLKEDTAPGGLRDFCKDYADHHGLPYQELRLSDPNPGFWFDVMAGLGRDEARDAILALTEFDDAHWKSLSEKLMGQTLKLLYVAHEADPAGCPPPSVAEVTRIMADGSLSNATKKLRAVAITQGGFDRSEFDILESPSIDYKKQADSWGAKLGQFFETEAGTKILRPQSNKPMFDVTNSGIMYIGLDSQGKADLTKLVSTAVLQRLSADAAQRVTGQLKGDKRNKFIIVDEANWIDRRLSQSLLSRARSAGISMWFATQGPRDWIDKEGDDFGKLAQNVNVAIIMKQGDPESAEICANFLGKQEFHEQTLQHSEGDLIEGGSLSFQQDFKIQPEQLRELEIGEAVIRVGSPKARLTYTKIIMRSATRESVKRKALPLSTTPTSVGKPNPNSSAPSRDDGEPQSTISSSPSIF